MTVRGIEGNLWEGLNGTVHTIHWVEAGLDITVSYELHTADLSPPFEFTHDDELLSVAEGIVIER